MGIDAHLTPAELSAIEIANHDTVYVSGFDLAYPHGPALASWLEANATQADVLFDQGR